MPNPPGQSPKPSNRSIEVFRAGTFTAMNGQEYTFSAADVAAIAAGYDPETAPAPVVVGHPKHDDPAFGWAKTFTVNDEGVLVAELDELAPEFVEAVSAGRYRKVSMKFFPPDAANNPNPGNYYPRHIGFLGGAAPAVSGLKTVQFADDEADLPEIVFAEPALEDVASLFRKMREFIIEKFSRDDADEALPEYLIRWVDDAAKRSEPSNEPGFSDPKEEDPPVSANDDQLAARQENLDKRERELAHRENVSFVDGLIEEAKLLPGLKDRAVALLDALALQDETEIAFSDDGTDKKLSPSALFKDLLSGQPEIVPTGKVVIEDEPGATDTAFAAPDGMQVDSNQLALHSKAIAYQNQHPGTEYLTAVQAVQGS